MMNDKGNEMKVTFLSAKDGKVELYSGVDNLVAVAGSAEILAATIRELKLDLSDAYASSSMDFASEYGFGSDGMAWNMVECALETV
jgi:hypothetical protein